MTNFQKDYDRAKKYIPKDEIIYIQKYIKNILLPYIKDLQAKNPNLTVDEMEKLINEDAFNLAETAFKSSFAFDYYMHYISCQYLKSNPKIFDDIYDKLKSGELKVDPIKVNMPSKNNFKDYLLHYTHSASKAFEEVYKQCEKLINSDSTLKSILENPELKAEEKIKIAQNYINKNVSSKHDRDTIMKCINCYVIGLKKYLPYDEKYLSKYLNGILTESISSIAKQLLRLNLFEKYSEIERFNFIGMNFKEFISGKKSDITNPEILRNIPIHDLMILNSFWINRYAKELDTYSEGIFAIQTLNLLPKILDNSFDISDINQSDLEATLTKCSMLRKHVEYFIAERREAHCTGKLPENSYTVSEDGNYITYSFAPFAKRMKSNYSSNYKDFFRLLLPEANNDVEQNSMLYAKLISPVIGIYDMKSEILNSLISNLGNNSDIVNAGIIPDSISDDGTKITLNPNFVCLGLDTKLTFPVREHIKLSILKDFLVSLQNGNEYIPIYEGNEDFKFSNGRNISAQQILPFTKEQEKLLKKVSATQPEGKNKDFILHLNWLRDSSKVPEKFKSTIIDSKGRMKKIFIPKYVNLEEYEPDKELSIYIKINDEFVRITPEMAKAFSSPIDSSQKSNKQHNKKRR